MITTYFPDHFLHPYSTRAEALITSRPSYQSFLGQDLFLQTFPALFVAAKTNILWQTMMFS